MEMDEKILQKFDKNLKHYYLDSDYNCAEAMLLACNDTFEMHLSEDAIKAMAGFGGGMLSGSACGAIAGSVAALSILHVDGRGHTSPLLKEKVENFMELLQKELGSENCRDLKPKLFAEDVRCLATLYAVRKVLLPIL